MKPMTAQQLEEIHKESNRQFLAGLIKIEKGMETIEGKKAIQKQIREFKRNNNM